MVLPFEYIPIDASDASAYEESPVSQLDIRPRLAQKAVIFDVSGEIDLTNAQKVKEAVYAWIGDGHKDVILNMKDVRYMDSSGLSVLIAVKSHLNPLGGTVSLVGCPQIIRRMLSVTRLNTVLPAYETEEDALCSSCGGAGV